MSIKYTNLTYNELRELAPKDKPFQVVVQSNPHGKGGKQTLWTRTMTKSDVNSSPSALQSQEYYIDTEGYGQYDIDDVDYNCNRFWKEKYKGTFDLIIHHLDDTILEQFKVGDEVEVLKNTECKNGELSYVTPYNYSYHRNRDCLFQVSKVNNYTNGSIDYELSYKSYGLVTGEKTEYLPIKVGHNCLRKVVSKEGQTPKKVEQPKTITIGDKTFGLTEDLTNALKNLKEID